MSNGDCLSNLHRIRDELQGICDSIKVLGSQNFNNVPVIDYARDGDEGPILRHPSLIIQGLKTLRDTVKRDLEALEKFIARPDRASLSPPSTNAPYLIAVWNEIISAPPWVSMVERTFRATTPAATTSVSQKVSKQRPTSTKNGSVKVDVVADDGKLWIRVNTIKNSRLLAEFREQDSYLTGSEDEEDDDENEGAPKILANAQLANSLIDMGKSLLSVAAVNLTEDGEIPRVKLRLPRLYPGSKAIPDLLNEGMTVVGDLPSDSADLENHMDPRISRTISELLRMGVSVELGERRFRRLDEAPPALPPNLVPTQRINVDLSVLVALSSDMVHSPLPSSVEEARLRFIPTAEEKERAVKRREKLRARGLLKGRGDADSLSAEHGAPEVSVENGTQQSRALSHQLMREMHRGLIEELHDRLCRNRPSIWGQEGKPDESDTPKRVEFWTTSEVRHRFLRIVSKIGGTREKRRASALFWPLDPNNSSRPEYPQLETYQPLEEAEDAYWTDSRYPNRYVPFLPIHVYSTDLPTTAKNYKSSVSWNEPFWAELRGTCARILSQDVVPDPRTQRELPTTTAGTPSDTRTGTPGPTEDEPNGFEGYDDSDPGDGDNEIQRAFVTRANPRLTAHTVQTMSWGSTLGCTTITANRTSVRAILREMKWLPGEAIWDSKGAADKTADVAGADRNLNDDPEVHKSVGPEQAATIWIVEPRSLAEGMRGDIAQ